MVPSSYNEVPLYVFLAYFNLGLSFKEKWNTDNTLSTEVTIEDQIAQGCKISLDTSFSPQTG